MTRTLAKTIPRRRTRESWCGHVMMGNQAMKKDTDGDSNWDSEYVGNRRRGSLQG